MAKKLVFNRQEAEQDRGEEPEVPAMDNGRVPSGPSATSPAPIEPELPVLAKVFDINAAKATIDEWNAEVAEMVTQAKDLVVNNDKSAEDATALGTRAMSIYKKIIAAKEKIPNYIEAKEYVDKSENFVQMLSEKLYTTRKTAGDTVVSLCKSKIAQWNTVKLAEKQKADELARKATEELNKKLREEGFKGDAAPPILPKGQTTVRTESGSSHPKTVWTFEVLDRELPSRIVRALVESSNSQEAKDILPYIVILYEDTAIREAVKKGARDPMIGGIHIYEKVDTIFRTK